MRAWILLLLVLAACNTDETPRARLGEIEGTAWFLGPVAGAPVALHLSDSQGSDRGRVAETLTDDEGSFYFIGLEEEAHYLVSVDLSGLPWKTPHAAGAFAQGDRLETATGLIEPYAREVERKHRFVAVSPLSTLVMSAAASLRAVNRETALPEVRLAAKTWLGLDPLVTPIGAPEGALDDAVRHALLIDAFSALADDISASVGVQPGTAFNPPDLLRFVIADALGAVPAGTLDGEGIDGPITVSAARNYALSADTLQTELRDALDHLVDDEDGPWGRLDPRDLTDLRTRLSCSGASLFPDCKSERTDATPPQLVSFIPEADEVLSGERTIKLRWHDGESVVARVILERLDAPEGAVLESYEVEFDGQETFSFQVDTRQVLGSSTLYLQTRATNDARLTSPTYPLQYAVRNVGPGIIDGLVYKGPAQNVLVQIDGIVDGTWRPLATTTTNALGRFQADLTEYQGPLLLTARGQETAEGSFYQDEARNALVRWGSSQQLVALLPFYDPALEQPITISPLSDLAYALAQKWSREGEEDLFEAYLDAARRIGRHFGFEDPANTLMRAVPADPLQDSGGLTDSVLFMVALACLAEQARGMGCEALECEGEDISRGFTALHLVEMYRKDAEDGILDGRLASQAIDLQFPGGVEARMPADLFRLPLASACGRWLLNPDANRSGITLGAFAGRLEDLADNRDIRLFGPLATQLPPRPFDDAGPTLKVTVERIEDEPTSRLYQQNHREGPIFVPRDGDPPHLNVYAAGAVRLVIEATDDVGVAVTGDGGPPMIGADLVGDARPESLRLSGEPAEVGVRRTRTTTATLTTSALPRELEGLGQPIRISATDLLGNTTEQTFFIHLDRVAPRIGLDHPAQVGIPNAEAGRHNIWYTNALDDRLSFRALVTDTTPIEVTITLGDDPLLRFDGERTLDQPAFLPVGGRQEGVHHLIAHATDALGHTATETIEVHIDRTPPTLAFDVTRYFDEAFIQATCNDGDCRLTLLENNPHIELRGDAGPENPNPYNKIQLKLSDVDDNLPILRMQVSDPPGCGECPLGRPTTHPGQLHLSYAGDELPPDFIGSAQRSLILSGERVGIDFIEEIPPAGTLWPPEGERTLILRDLARNETRIQVPVFALNILPPPLVVEDRGPQAAARVVPLPGLSVAGLAEAVRQNSALQVGRWQLYNPWPVTVGWHIGTPPPLQLTVTTEVVPEREADVLGADLAAVSGPGFDETRLDAPCLLRDDPFHIGPGAPRRVPDSSREATPVVSIEVQPDGRRVRFLRAAQCRARVGVVDPPPVALGWDVGVIQGGALIGNTDSWTDLAPAARFDLEGRVLALALPAELAATFAGNAGGRTAAIFLDAAPVLVWNDPGLGCIERPDHPCRRGWWLTRRVRQVSSTELEHAELPISFAASCFREECDEARTHLQRTLAPHHFTQLSP